jgi:hypothetical protein
MEQRLESVEAYFQNGDPTAPLQGHQWQLDGEFWAGPSIINTNLINSLGNMYPSRVPVITPGCWPARRWCCS